MGKLAADHPEVPLLPVFLRGTERALPRKASLPLPIWQHVSIGPPQRLDGGIRDITDTLRESILALERSEIASRHKRRPERHQRLRRRRARHRRFGQEHALTAPFQ